MTLLFGVGVLLGVLIVCFLVMLALLKWSAADEPAATLESGQASHRRPSR